MKKLVAALIVLNALAWSFALIPRVESTGSLSIPNTISAQPGGNLAASLLDANWTAIRDYVNNREVAIGVLAARPVAGTAGRWYLASDTNGGTLYADSGAAWTQAGAGVSQGTGLYGVRGLIAGTTSLTVVNASATQVQLRSPSDGSIVIRTTDATASLANNTLTAGPTANGRDQVAQFPASSWVHVYYIWNGTTLATLSSACAPSDVNGACAASSGPTLPTGYTHWAYIGPYRYNASSQYLLAEQRCGDLYYRASQTVVNNGTATAETAVSAASVSAPNASVIHLVHKYDNTGAGGSNSTLRLFTGLDHYILSTTATQQVFHVVRDLPNLNNNAFFYVNSSGAATGTSFYVLGFHVPNGGC